MKRFYTVGLVVVVFFALVAAVGAVRGIHQPSGNRGFLGADLGGVFGDSTGTSPGVYGYASGEAPGTYGLGKWGVMGAGRADTHTGVSGVSSKGYGVFGQTNGTLLDPAGVGAAGYAGNGGVGLYGYSTSAGWAGMFSGDVRVYGTLVKSAGSFMIDHPLDPANKYLSHSFVESPDMKNIYDGVVQLDRRGEAVVTLPDWFDALNKDFRYQLTTIGEHAPVYVADEVSNNQFRIAGGYSDMKVSWQVTGTRRDPYAVAHPIPVEHMKPPHERGRLLHPDAYGQPPSAGVNFERERMLMERRIQSPRRMR